MLYFLVIVYLVSCVIAQNNRGPQNQDYNEPRTHGWDIRLAVPGEPGNDYPTLSTTPRTTFSCAGREPGYYADIETNCQVFRVCTVGSTYGFQSFLCPNGTLFNQAVFVCDWWMNVNCENSGQFVRNHNEQFENLRLGPELMKDIKKMLTHPMQNPYNKIAMKSNFIVMQDYKPPVGQLFPNGALLAGPERTPTMISVPKQNLIQNYINSDVKFSGTTQQPKYTPSAFTTIKPTTFRNTEIFQKQRLNGQYTQSSRSEKQNVPTGNTISNGHTSQFTQFKNTAFINNNVKTQHSKQNTKQINEYRSQRLTQPNNSGTIKTKNVQNIHRGQVSRQNSQYTDHDPKKSVQNKNTLKYSEQKSNIIQDQNVSNISFTQSPYELAEEIQNEVKQNVVSKFNHISPAVTTKTIAYSRIIENPQPGKPKSKITVKTWIIKPTKSTNLIASPPSFTYDNVIQAPHGTVINKTSPYVYEKPTTQSPPVKIISKPNPTPYVYKRLTNSAKSVNNKKNGFNNLSLSSTFLPSTTPVPILRPRPVLLERLNISPTLTSTNQTYWSNIDITTSKPSSRLYLPPQNTFFSRQYLSSIIEPPVFYSSNQVSYITTSPTPVFVRHQIHNIATLPLTTGTPLDPTSNITFNEILTKDKLDESVNTIVKDTNDILKTTLPPEFPQYDQNVNIVNIPDDDSKTESVTDSGESLTSQLPTIDTKSARLIALPSTNLEPPDESFTIENENQLSELPYFKESLLPPANTIERTVSLRITIPEKVAQYLFRNSSERDYDKLEILNTENSNYLVLTNSMATPNTNFVPIGKLGGSKNINISNSQALVFSLLADSINAAKEYSNIAQQEVLSSTSAPTQFQNINNEELSQITNKISQLTSSQFSGNNYDRNSNIVATAQTLNTQGNSISNNIQYGSNQQAAIPQVTSQQTIAQQLQNNFPPLQSQQQQNYYTMNPYQVRNNDFSANLLTNNGNQIYSGQLYQYSVPEVTNQIYNRPFTSDFLQASSTPQNIVPNNFIPVTSSQNNNAAFIQSTNIPARNTHNSILLPSNNNKVANFMNKQPSFEIVQSESLPFRPARVELDPSNEPNSLNQKTVTNLLNSNNGISAQLHDKIIGTIPHPLENNKLVTYEKDQSYFFTTKLDNLGAIGNGEINSFSQLNTIQNQNSDRTQNTAPNALTFQLIPSVGYQLDNEKDQQQLLNTFRIDEFGAPRDIAKTNTESNNNNQEVPVTTTNVNFSIDHPKPPKQTDGSNRLSALYSGPSSYFPPQSFIGNLGTRQDNVQNNFNSRLEDLSSNNEKGYPKTRPTRQFIF